MEVAGWFLVWLNAPSLLTKTKKDTPMVKVFGVDREIDIPESKFPNKEELESLECGIEDCEHGWYDSVYGGAKLHYRKCLPSTKKPKAVVIYQHGIQTHGGKSLILKNGRKLNCCLMREVFLANNIALYAPDMYGHGYSEGTRFLVPKTWKNNLQDLLNFVDIVQKEQGESVPLFLMGESYGGTLTLHAARYYQDNPDSAPKSFKGVLLTGPAIKGDLPPAPVVFFLRNILAPSFPKWTPFFMPNPVTHERIWRDKEVLMKRTEKRYIEMCVDGSGKAFRLGTAANLLDAMEEVREKTIPGFNIPFCLIHGDMDAGVPVDGSDYMWATVDTPMADRVYHRVEGGYHDMLSDPFAEEAMGHCVAFINDRVSK